MAAATTQSAGLRLDRRRADLQRRGELRPEPRRYALRHLGVDRDLRTPYVTNWTVNVQQAFWENASIQLAYVGNQGSKLYGIRDINQVDPDSPAEEACGHCEQAGRPFNSRFPFLGYINFIENSYNSLYNGLQLTMTQRTYKGLNYVLGYTWSHAIDFASLQRAAQPQNSFNQRAERASSDLDIRHRFTLALTYDLPGIQVPAAAARKLAGEFHSHAPDAGRRSTRLISATTSA